MPSDGLVDGFATARHYLSHLAPVYLALPPERRGRFYVAGGLADTAGAEGVPGLTIGYPPPGHRPVMVAGFADEQVLQRPVIYLEHGAGQRYQGDPASKAFDDPCYSGSPGHERCILFLSPSETVAGRWRDRYPHVPAVAVGCPKLDHLMASRRAGDRRGRTVAFSWHSAVPLCEETQSAIDHYDAALPATVAELWADGWEVLGHGHPRLWRRMSRRWAELGVEPVPDLAEVIARTDVFCVDNSSSLYEAASCAIPTVAMNAPSFRRSVHHELRFWDCIPGATVDGPDELVAAIRLALIDPPQMRDQREKVVSQVYANRDGTATKAAIDAVLAVLGDLVTV